jgi:O-antigen/teichoic acid export membrane protein
MTRLLTPDMFGVVAIATVVMTGLAMFSDLGLRPSIVQSKRGDESAFLNTAWVVQIVRGAILWAAALGISLSLAVINWFDMAPKNSVYADPRLPYVVSIISASAFIIGFNSTKLLEASRKLAFGRVTLIEIVAQLSTVLCILIWALFDRSVWALVTGYLCSASVTMLLSHFFLPGTTNRWQWDNSAFQEIFQFGKWIFLSSILAFIATSGDRILLGGMTDTAVLGIYVIAYTLVASAEAVLSKIIGGVSFPALSEIARERPHALKQTYYRLHAIIAPSVYFVTGILMFSGHVLIRLLYDPRYEAAGWMLQILAVGLLALPFQIAIQCFLALGLPQLHSRILAVRLIVLIVAMPAGFFLFALQGALWGLVFSQLACLPMIIIYAAKFGLLNPRRELIALLAFPIGMAVGASAEFII